MADQRTRRCPSCQLHLPLSKFRTRKSTRTAYERSRYGEPYGSCKPCRRLRDLERRNTVQGFLANLSRNIFARCRSTNTEFSLTTDALLAMHKAQSGRCAVTNLPMTSIIGEGQIQTNISVDRLIIGGPYTPENTRLVCHSVNIMRNTMSDDELLGWCQSILDGMGRPRP